jgi:hypothetical protein
MTGVLPCVLQSFVAALVGIILEGLLKTRRRSGRQPSMEIPRPSRRPLKGSGPRPRNEREVLACVDFA